MVSTADLLGSSSSSSQGALANFSAGSSGNERKGRRSKHDNSDLSSLASLTGAENVPVIHRETGKKVRRVEVSRVHFIVFLGSLHTSYSAEILVQSI